MSLRDISIQYIKGVGPAKAKILEQLGIQTVEDALYFFPRRYEDRSQITPLNKLKLGEWQTVCGEVLARGNRRSWYSKKHVFEIAVGNETGRVMAVWFNMPYLDKYFHPGQKVVLYGKVDLYKKRIQMISPEYELIDKTDDSLNTGRIVPIYPLTRGVTQRYLRKLIRACLDDHSQDLVDVLPEYVRARHHLPYIREGIETLHFPSDEKSQETAQNRIAFEEFFFFQISVMLRRMALTKKRGTPHRIDKSLLDDYIKAMPFTLTDGQLTAMAEIAADMKKSAPMLRLLQGDVGCGKTVAAFFGCVTAYANGYQSAVMAPTEILAEQHYGTFLRLIEGAPFASMRVRLLHSGTSKAERTEILKELKSGKVHCVVGTHALLQGDVAFQKLTYVVVDEQHKFGVGQRALLADKADNPDMLVMTATPIPRTLCLTLYGDLDVSTIQGRPAMRGKIKTYHVLDEEAEGVYVRVREWIAKGTQAYIVYPLVEESDTLDLKAATDMFRHLSKGPLKGVRVGLVHGQMDRAEARGVMDAFKARQLDVLVATTVLEVGIDVPNANIMVIEHAERFGLSQLHQLRGRIGRGEKNAVCILLGDPQTEEGKRRIEALLKSDDGFTIAEYDLAIRGPGQYFGRHQHGLSELRVANPAAQMALLEVARQDAQELLKTDPLLKKSDHAHIKRVVKQRYPEYLKRVLAG